MFLQKKVCDFFIGLSRPNKSVYSLGKSTYGSPRSTYKILDMLSDKGLIDIDCEVNNKKQLVVTITQKGRDALLYINKLRLLS